MPTDSTEDEPRLDSLFICPLICLSVCLYSCVNFNLQQLHFISSQVVVAVAVVDVVVVDVVVLSLSLYFSLCANCSACSDFGHEKETNKAEMGGI